MIPSNMINKEIKTLDDKCLALNKYRDRDLLVLYYPVPDGTMHQNDVSDTYKELRSAGYSKEKKIGNLDILTHTYGGDPIAGYRLAQVIRDFSDNVVFLVPEFAYSAGTLLCFAGDEIRLGDYAGISPIDIKISDDSSGRGEVSLANIECFLDFAKKARVTIETSLMAMASKNTSSVESDLLVKLVEQETAIKVGEYFREQELTGIYANELLSNYMFAHAKNSSARCEKIIEGLLKAAPSHEFHVDYHMCLGLGLEVKEMPTEESDLAKDVITTIDKLAQSGIICENLLDDWKMPFIRYYPKANQKQRIKT
jgi:hypothetical protein